MNSLSHPDLQRISLDYYTTIASSNSICTMCELSGKTLRAYRVLSFTYSVKPFLFALFPR